MIEKVLVIMSTYNGEKYIYEQLMSIFAQKEVEVSLWVRDDGSSDKTLVILEELKRTYPIHFYQGEENLGPACSFLSALKKASNNYDYFAYADQDDIWFPEKLKNACRALSKYSVAEPSLYCSTYDVVDDELNLLFKRNLRTHIPFTLESTIIDRSPSGCTMIFNKVLRDIICSSNPASVRMHDYWTLLTAEVFDGNIYIDNNSTMLYRQHGNNSVGYTNKNIMKRVKRLAKSAFNNKNERQKQINSLYACYKDQISSEKLKEIEKVVFYRENLSRRYELLTSKNFYTDTKINTLLFKFSVLMGLF